MASLFSPQVDQVNLPDVTGLVSKLTSLNRTNPFTSLNEKVLNPYLQGQHNIGVATAKNELLKANSHNEALDIMNTLRSKGFTETQLEDAGVQNILDKKSELDLRNAQMENQKLQSKKMQDEMNYLAQTRDADALLARVIQQGIESGEGAKYAMAAIYNDPEFQRKLAANPQAMAKINELWLKSGWNTKLLEEDASSPTINPHTALTAFQKVIGDISSKVGGLPGDWHINPSFKDKESTFNSLTANIKDPEDVASIREDFEKALNKVNAKYAGLPEQFKLALVASSIDKNYLPFTSPFDFGNLDDKLEKLALNDITYIQDSLNMIYNYGPAQQELQKIISERAIDKLVAAKNFMEKSILNNSNLTPSQKRVALKQMEADHSKTLQTMLRNTTTAIRDSGHGVIRRIIDPNAQDSAELKAISKAQKEKEAQALKFKLMTTGSD